MAKLTYKINFVSGANRGNDLVDAIAHTVGGSWNEKGCNDSFGTIEIDEEMSQAMDDLLNIDDNVLRYRAE